MTEPRKTPPTARAPPSRRRCRPSVGVSDTIERPATATILNERERTSVGVSDTIEPPPPPPPKSENG